MKSTASTAMTISATHCTRHSLHRAPASLTSFKRAGLAGENDCNATDLSTPYYQFVSAVSNTTVIGITGGLLNR